VGEESLITLAVVHLEGNHRADDHPQRTLLLVPATASDQPPPATAERKGKRMES
jgi:hypothetical protein